MLRSAHSRVVVRVRALAALTFIALAAPAQQQLTREGNAWVRTVRGSAPASSRLRVAAHGPVTLEGGAGKAFDYSLKVSVRAHSEAEARRILARYAVNVETRGGWTVLTLPGGQADPSLSIRAPRLEAAEIVTTDGSISAAGIDGPLTAGTGAGAVAADRIRGLCRLTTGGGEIRVGRVEAGLQCRTGGGHIVVRFAGGETLLETNGGDITATEAGGPVIARTGAGTVRLARARGAVSAVTGGGEIVVDRADGVVTARNMAGRVRVGAAAGVRCESGNGGVRLDNVAGSMHVSTGFGSIIANLAAGKLAESLLATRNGDIVVTIPSNLGVTIRAENAMADTIQRIISEFPGVPVRMRGMRVVAEGAVNGGGPLLQISDTGGTIFLKRQR